MTEPLLDLLGDELPEPLPQGLQLTDWRQLTGHKILAAIDEPGGRRQADMLIITETNCWMALKTESDGDECGGARVSVVSDGTYHGQTAAVFTDFASAAILFATGCITQPAYAHLKEIEDAAKAKESAEQAARFRRRADELSPPTVAVQPSNGSM